jgi:hypothetical protein
MAIMAIVDITEAMTSARVDFEFGKVIVYRASIHCGTRRTCHFKHQIVEDGSYV